MRESLFPLWRLLIGRSYAHIALRHPVAALVAIVILPARSGRSTPTGIGRVSPRGPSWFGTRVRRTGGGVAGSRSSPAWGALRHCECV